MMSFEIETALLLTLACAVGVAFGLLLRRRAEHRRRISLFAQTTFLPLDDMGQETDAETGRMDTQDGPASPSDRPISPGKSMDEPPSSSPSIDAPGADRPPPSNAKRRTAAASVSAPGDPQAGTLGEGAEVDQPTLFALTPAPVGGDPALPGRRPPALAQPDSPGADDLKQLKGIGPLNERKLNALGIYHFRQIADWTQDEARWIGASLGFRGRVEREDWIGQARARTPSNPSTDDA
ncbi:hypothetical protein [Roseixanthobacter pseudopolyaromaticivorans]|uniref:hypothetical protein n=1 Tax=Xanthobacteraceae TaxID=335928 RepID=UPI003729C29D